MSIVQLTRFTVDPSQAERAKALIERVRRLYENTGAEYEARPANLGESGRQLIAAARYPDWETYGRAMAELRASDELARLETEMDASGVLTRDGRALVEDD